MWRWLDYVPLVPLAIAAVVLGLSPPLAEPHLLQKLRLLVNGQPLQRIDLIDLLLHLVLPFLLALKLLRALGVRRHGG